MFQPPSQYSVARSRTEIGVEVSLAILVCLSATLGNLLVVYVINRDSRLQNVTNTFIHSLALTDIAMATIYMPFWIASLFAGTWIFSQKWCEVTGSIMSILASTSILTLGLIAFNRYIKVVKPTLYRKVFPSKKAAKLYCAFVWLVSILLAIPFLGGWVGISYHTKLGICTVGSKAYTKGVVGVFMNGVMILIFYCYFKIYKAVKGSTANIYTYAKGNGVVTSNEHPANRSNNTNVKVLKTCFAVACFFVITWCPVSIVAVAGTSRFDVDQKIYTASVFLMFSSSLVNPFIFGFMNPQFKLVFKKVLKCGGHRNGNIDLNQTGNGVRDGLAGELKIAA